MSDCDLYAPEPDPILMTGERGTGKSELAGYIHARSGRTGKLVRYSAAAALEDLAYAELAGSNRGGFSGAITRAGMLEEANHGTLFIDDLADAPPRVQSLLLDVIGVARCWCGALSRRIYS